MDLSARNLKKYGMRRGAYDGSRKRRFVLFASVPGTGSASVEICSEFDTKRERDEYARRVLADRIAIKAQQ